MQSLLYNDNSLSARSTPQLDNVEYGTVMSQRGQASYVQSPKSILKKSRGNSTETPPPNMANHYGNYENVVTKNIQQIIFQHLTVQLTGRVVWHVHHQCVEIKWHKTIPIHQHHPTQVATRSRHRSVATHHHSLLMVMDGEVAKEVSHLPHFHIIHYCTAIHQMKGHSMEHSMHNNDSISEVPVQAVCTTEVDTVVEAV